MVIEKKQIQQIQTIMAPRFADREERLDYMSSFFKTDLKSTKELTFIEAEEFIYFLNTGDKKPANWAFFDKTKFVSERKKLFSYLHQADWTVANDKYGEVPDLERLSNFLKSAKSPVNKPLKKFNKQEWSKLIEAFKNIVKSTYK